MSELIKNVGGRPKKDFSEKIGKVILYLPNAVLLRYPADRIKREIIDLYNGDEELGMLSEPSKEAAKPVNIVSDKMARAREALKNAESKQSIGLTQHQKNTIEAFGAVVVNPYAHNIEAHKLCDKVFNLIQDSNNNKDLINRINALLGELEDIKHRI